jgi:hypothetical protein
MERLLTIFAFVIFLAFLGILIGLVRLPDLGAVLLLTVLLAGWDMFFHKPNSGPPRVR